MVHTSLNTFDDQRIILLQIMPFIKKISIPVIAYINDIFISYCPIP